ncbi:hypothetical protein H1R20_g5480, partial [Candolleomyces eurysporus]
MSAIEKEISPRVNSAMLPNWINKTVRLTCKLVKFNDGDGRRLTVEAPDGGQVTVHVLKDDVAIADSYLEVIGKVVDATTIQMLGCISMGNDLGASSSSIRLTSCAHRPL